MGLDVLEVARGDVSLGADPPDQGDLGVGAGHGDAVGAAVLVDAAAEDDGVHRVPVGQRLVQPLEGDQADALGSHVPLCRGVEGPGAAARREEAALGLGDRVLRCRVQQDAPASARSLSPRSRLWQARWTVTREELHAVSTVRLGPLRSRQCEIRFDTIVIIVPVAVCAARVSKLRSANWRIL